MRLLLLTPEFASWGGGITTFYRPLLAALQALGVSVRVVEGSATSSAASRYGEAIDGIPTERLELSRFYRWHDRFGHLAAVPTLRRHLAAAWALWEQACEGPDFDIVEATDWGLLFVPPVIAGTHPTVAQAHGSCGQISLHDPVAGDEASDLLVRLIELAVLARATQVQTSSEANASFWQAETGREVRMLRPAWGAAGLPAPILKPSRRGLVVGRVQRWKGPDTLCDALQLLGPEAPHVDWIGREVLWGRRSVSAGAHLTHRYPDIWGRLVSHHPPQAPPEITSRQANAGFNVIPSRWDVFNFVTIEALASGRPAIVSTGAGASELIEDGVNGFVFPAGDARALALAIERAQALPPARQTEMAYNASETVKRILAPENVAAKRLAEYHAAAAHAASTHIPSWLAQACSPSQADVGEDEFLDHFPMRMLASHLARRSYKRLTRR